MKAENLQIYQSPVGMWHVDKDNGSLKHNFFSKEAAVLYASHWCMKNKPCEVSFRGANGTLERMVFDITP
jgi:hypothetical protein